MTRLLRRLRYVLRRDRHERELDDELRFHLDMKQQELESRGVERATAAANARRALGNLPLTRDHVRDVWIAPWLRSAAQDVRFAGRLLLRERGFTLAVVVVLGVGMALTGAMYTVVNAIMFGSLPGDDDGRIVSLGTQDAQGRTAGVSLADFEDWRDGNETFDGMAVMFGTSLNVSDDEVAPEMVVGAYVSHGAFRLLRTPPLLGRDFLPADDVDGAPGTAILSHGLWMSRYGGDPDVIGRTIRVNDRPSVLIGVMPEGFAFPFARDDHAGLHRARPRRQRRADGACPGNGQPARAAGARARLRGDDRRRRLRVPVGHRPIELPGARVRGGILRRRQADAHPAAPVRRVMEDASDDDRPGSRRRVAEARGGVTETTRA